MIAVPPHLRRGWLRTEPQHSQLASLKSLESIASLRKQVHQDLPDGGNLVENGLDALSFGLFEESACTYPSPSWKSPCNSPACLTIYRGGSGSFANS